MKKLLLVLSIIISVALTSGCSTKITNPNVFKSGIYESKTDGVVSNYYSFYPAENSGTINNVDGMSGLPFRYDISEVNGNQAKIVFHFADESDNTEVTVTMKNENEYLIKYSNRTDELKFVNEDLDKLDSYFKFPE